MGRGVAKVARNPVSKLQKKFIRTSTSKDGYWQYPITVPADVALAAGISGGDTYSLGVASGSLVLRPGAGERSATMTRKKTRTHLGRDYFVTSFLIPNRVVAELGWKKDYKIRFSLVDGAIVARRAEGI